MARLPDEWDSPGENPLFMSQGYDGHIAINTNDDDGNVIDNRNCREPSVNDMSNNKRRY